jgi:DNA polymerase I-like protein with 3'-5' exonuclease and polymerase domains
MAKKPKAPRPVTVDFESVAVDDAPFYPPPPTGVSIKYPGKKSRHYAWGHIEGNNSTFLEAQLALLKAWNHPAGVLMHHAKFDMALAEIHMGMPELPWERLHDSMLLLFLDDPHQKNMGLKPAAKRLLEMPEDERDAVADWLVRRQPVPGVKITAGPKSKNTFMKFLAWAPGGLVGQYADGDVERTELIFNQIHATVQEREMGPAYDRERQLMIVLREMERQGVRVDVDRLRTDVAMYGDAFESVCKWIAKKLLAPAINLDSGAELVAALDAAGLVDLTILGITESGVPRTDKASLEAAVKDRQLSHALRYRGALKTCLGTFMRPWLATAEASGGLIFTTWNQTRSPDGGTRTGRLSSTPNFQNLPREFDSLFAEEVDKATAKAKKLPKMPVKLPPLPRCRGYIIPTHADHVLLGRDFSAQEPRILAHFEQGALLESYQANPWMDFHDNNKEKIEAIFKKTYSRKPIKNIGLGIIYGQGIGSLAEKNEQPVEETKKLKDAFLTMYPGIKDMYADMKFRAKNNMPFRTWGGRSVHCEPPMIIKGRIVTFDYKCPNYLIQGSAADATKEALIRLRAALKPSWFIILQVHDELTISAPRTEMHEAMAVLKQAMESVEFDVPLFSEGEWSPENWGSMQVYDKKGVRVDADAK